MGVREATSADIEKCIAVARQTLDRSLINAELSTPHVFKVMRRCINDANLHMWVAEHKGETVGFLMAIKEQHWFSRQKYASDICFCVDPKHGNYAPSMVRRFIKWAKKDDKVVDINLGISSGLDQDGRTGRMYQKLGFTPVGGIYSLK